LVGEKTAKDYRKSGTNPIETLEDTDEEDGARYSGSNSIIACC
jgi:hypothetical protein